jgi:O-antigen ligase
MEKAILYSAFVPLTLYVITISLGAVVLTHVGPVGFVQPRPVALYLLVVLALALANWRYGTTTAGRRLGFIVTLTSLGIIIFTLSRTAALVGLLMVPLSRSNPARIWTTVIGAVLGVVIAGSLFFAVPALQQRLFFKSDIKPTEALQYLNTSGRSVMWSETYSDAMAAPILGHCPGSARILLGRILHNRGEEGTHPHNEYLQVFHDMGLVGLVLFIMAWVLLTFQFWRTWKHAVLDKTKKLTTHKWSMAALLSVVAIISTAVTDNTIHYAFVMAPAFIIVGIALRCSRGDL